MSPYQDADIAGRILRTFSIDVESDEMKWHRDARDRRVTVISGIGWLLQIEDGLPVEMAVGRSFFISKDSWHRIHKGKTDLVVLIDESG